MLWDDGFWQAFADLWQEGMPELSCQASPPAGMEQPKRGFGLVWCDQSSVRQGLGWALQEEYGYSSPQQAFERGSVVLDATGSIAVVLLDDGTLVQYALTP